MNKTLILPILIVLVSLTSSIAYAGMISAPISDPAYYDHPYFGNNNLKLELHYDNDGNGNDLQKDNVNCSWYNPMEWFDEDGDCDNEAYDYIINPSTNEVVGEWSMFKLQRKTGNNWKTLKILNHKFEDCSADGTACVKRLIRFDENTAMNVYYILKDDDNKIKFDIYIVSGITNGEYRLKYKLDSIDELSDEEEKTVSFNQFFYDWNDITNYPVSYTISEDGKILEQTTELGVLPKDEVIRIDPIIQTTTAIGDFGNYGGNIIEYDGTDTYVLSANSTNLLMYKSTDEGATWNLQATSAPSVALGTYYPVTMMKENNMMHIITWDSLGNYYKYRRYNLTSDAFTSYINITAYTSTVPAGISVLEYIPTANTTHDALCWGAKATTINVNCIYRATGTADASFTNSQINWNITGGAGYPILAQYLTGSQKYLMNCVWNATSSYCQDFTPNNLTLQSSYNAIGKIGLISLIELDDGTLRIFASSPINSTTFSNATRTFSTVWEREMNLTMTYLPIFPPFRAITRDTSGYCHFVGRADPLASADEHYVYKKSTNTNCQFDHLVPEYNMTWLDVKEPSQSDISVNDFITIQYPRYANQVSLVYVNNSILYFDKAPQGLTINAYNEETNALLTAWDITISNSTTSVTQNGINLYTADWAGSLTIKISKTGYYDRFYYANLSSFGDYYLLNAYLLNISNGQNNIFITTTTFGNIISNVKISIYKIVPGQNNTLIEQKYTDGTGTAQFFLSPTVLYYVTAEKFGYNTLSESIMPTGSTVFLIMDTVTDTQWQGPLFGINRFDVQPYNNAWPLNSTVSNWVDIISNNGELAWFAMNITWYNGTNLYFANSTNATGGVLNFTNTYYELGNYTVNISLKRTGYPAIYTLNNTFYILNITEGPYTIPSISTNIVSVTGTQRLWIMSFFTMFIALCIGIWLGQYSGFGGMFGVMVWIIIATGMGWFEPLLGTITVLSALFLGFLHWKGGGE